MARERVYTTRPTATFHDMMRTMRSLRKASGFEIAAREAE